MNGFAMEMNTFLGIMARKPFAPKTKVREIEGWELVKLMKEVNENGRADNTAKTGGQHVQA